ncbi:MAG TPA: hypothetical protein VF532_00440 [Candidatus Angelobacter sp.]
MHSEPWISLTAQHFVTQLLKYAGILTTTGLSIHSLRIETVDKSKEPHPFTPAGKKYLRLLIGLTVLTTLAAFWADRVDKLIKDVAEKRGNEEFRKQLTAAMLDGLNPKLKSQEEQIDNALERLRGGVDGAARKLNQAVENSSDRLDDRLHRATYKLQSANDPLDQLTIALTFAHKPVKDVHFNDPEVEKRLLGWDSISKQQQGCQSCSMLAAEYKNRPEYLPLMSELWQPGTKSHWDILFRSFELLLDSTNCDVPLPWDAEKSWTGDRKQLVSYPCLKFRVVSRGVKDVRDPLELKAGGHGYFRIWEDYSWVRFDPLPRGSGTIGDTDLVSVYGETCSDTKEKVEGYVKSFRRYPLLVALTKHRKNQMGISETDYEARFSRESITVPTRDGGFCKQIAYSVHESGMP